MTTETIIWYTPEEKLPPEYVSVLGIISGRTHNHEYDHALCLLEYAEDGCGWMAYDIREDFEKLTVHEWAEVEGTGGAAK